LSGDPSDAFAYTFDAANCAPKARKNQGMDSVSDTQENKRTFGLRSALGLSIGLGALCAAAPVVAQETGEPAEGAEESRRLGAVTVTATRREGATVQDVPIAVNALDADLLDEVGVQRINDLEQVAPSLQINQGQSTSNATTLNIRGVGTGGDNPGFEPAVGIFIDGVYRTRAGVAVGDLPELAGVEVLRGPQGTLFGRNVTAGALSITTAGPEREGRQTATASIGNLDAASFEYTATGAVSESMAARIDARYRRRDGFIEDVNSDQLINDVDRFIVRGQLVWEGENSDLRLIGDVASTDENCCGAVNLIAGDPLNPTVPTGTGAALFAIADINAFGGNIFNPLAQPGNPEARQLAVSPGRDFKEAVDDWGLSAEYNSAIGIGNFTSITAYRDWSAERNQDIDFSGVDRAFRDGYTTDDTMFTQEFRLQGVSGNIDWLVGAYGLYESVELTDTIRFGNDANLYADAITAGALEAATGIPGGFQLTGSLGPTVPSLFVNVPEGVIPGVSGPTVRLGFDPADPANSLAIASAFPSFFTPGSSVGDGQVGDDFTVDTTALALFTHNEISLSDAATLTVGLRYNYEEKELDADLLVNSPTGAFYFTADGQSVASQLNAIGAGGLLGLFLNPTVNPEFNGQYSDTQDYGEVTGTVKLAYEFTPNLLVYGGYTRGFKSGGWNLDRGSFDSVFLGGDGAQTSDLAFDEELVDSIEVGAKVTFLDGLGTLNTAIYYQDISGYQFNTFEGSSFVTFNADAIAQGVEIDLGLQPVEGLTLQGGFAWADSTYSEDVDELDTPLDGEQIGNIPEFTLTGSGTYRWSLTDTLDASLHGSFRWTDEIVAIEEGVPRDGPLLTDAVAFVNARAGISSADGRWQFSIFGENLTDEYISTLPFQVPEQGGVFAGYPQLPRTYGAELRINF
jgi:iron complex outermembrane recepter protein